MAPDQLIQFLLQLLILLLAALLGGEVARRLHQPSVLGELISGILIGRTVLGNIAPGLFTAIFQNDPAVTDSRNAVISLGLLLFLFVAGLEIDLSRMREMGKRVAIISSAGMLIPFLLGAGMVWLIPNVWTISGTLNLDNLALVLGTALSISALPVIARILMDMGLLQGELGVIVVTSAMISDIIGWLMFAVILSSSIPGGGSRPALLTVVYALSFAGFALTIGRRLGQRILRWIEDHQVLPVSVLGVTIAGVLLAGVISEWIGIHAIIGALLVGIGLSPKTGMRTEAFDSVRNLTLSFFAPLYFASLGLVVDFAGNFDLRLILLVLFTATLGKIGGAGFGAWMSGVPFREALAIGSGLNARGALLVILATIALEFRLVDEGIYVALIVTAIVTTLISGPLIHSFLAPD